MIQPEAAGRPQLLICRLTGDVVLDRFHLDDNGAFIVQVDWRVSLHYGSQSLYTRSPHGF